nr:LytTR family transcriptional regulator [Bacteroidota bacterium]
MEFLKKRYPFNDDLQHNAKIIFFISIGVLAFLLLFQPIDITTLSNTEIFYLAAGIAVSTFLSLSVNLIIIPSLFPRLFPQSNWTIRKEIFWNIWILFTITGSDFLIYSKLFEVIDFNFDMIGKILLVSFLPVAVLIVINQDRLLRSNLKSAIRLNEKLKENKHIGEKLVCFDSEYKNDSLTINVTALILIRSADNYIEVFYENDGVVKSQMVRSTLLKAEETLNEYDFISKCHRTFIVNTNKVIEVKGSSQGYKLFFEKIDFPALVSQKYISEFDKLI